MRIDVRHSSVSAPKRASFTLHAAKRAAKGKRAQRATTTGAQGVRIRQGGSDA